jgi:hypothetical protein
LSRSFAFDLHRPSRLYRKAVSCGLTLLLVSVSALVNDWWREQNSPRPPKPGRSPSLSEGDVLALAIVSQWSRFRSETDLWRFADGHLRPYFPNLLSRDQLNRRIRRALEPELRALQRALAATLADGSEAYRVLHTTPIPAIGRVRACRRGLFAGQAALGRGRVMDGFWVYDFQAALS